MELGGTLADSNGQITGSRTLKVIVQNVQKQTGLAGRLVDLYKPDVLLAQEVNLPSEPEGLFGATHTSRMGYGTAIYCQNGAVNVKRVASPHAEIGGLIRKKTTVADCMGVQFVTFHGYNGQPFKNASKLVDHVRAVALQLAPSSPVLFAGDFNTWTPDHLEKVKVSEF